MKRKFGQHPERLSDSAVSVFPYIIKRVGPRSLRQRDLSIKIVVDEKQDLNQIFKEIKQLNMKVKRVKIKDLHNGQQQLETMILDAEKRYICVFKKHGSNGVG
ncbi:hypothetical protein ACFOU2_19975 [Bacillus songklensis]|uniref:Uncharacterized protein n=2 Tax=Bacillus songklensis TaxID=1069116 RepID=A0ABV8B818_9BACI